MLEYRDATIDDLKTIVDIYNSTVAGRMVTADTEPVSVESRERWFAEHEPAHRPLWIVSSGGQTVGWVSFQSFYGRPAYRYTAEISIYLANEWRGKGMGNLILKHVLSNCERLQIKTLLGFIFGHNKPSIALFERNGFITWGNFPNVAELDGVERDLIIVGKRIY